MNLKITFKTLIMVVAIGSVMVSCSTPKNITYFQNVEDAEVIEIAAVEDRTIKVQPFDKLSIVVSSKDAALAQMFNLNVITNRTTQNGSFNGENVDMKSYTLGYNEGLSAYTVSQDGTIDFPVLGVLKVEGMSRSELAGFIKGEIVGRGYIKDPIVTVEFLNTGISVLGDVQHPGRYDLNTDQLTIVEAISLAGDIIIQGQRDNIMVLRRDGDKVITYRVDLTDAPKLMQSPAYFLKQGDVIYVEPNTLRKRSTVNNGNNVLNVSFWISVASLLTTAAVLLK